MNETVNRYQSSEEFMEENQGKLETALHKNYAKAEELLEDTGKVDKLLEKVEKICRTLGKFPIPIFSDVINDIPKLIWLIRDYVNHRYTAIPYASIVAVVAALIYLVSPIDLIPDAIPIAGMLDDMGVLTIVFKVIDSDLEDYWNWHMYQMIQ